MNALLPWIALALLFAVCAVREVSPDALTPAQIRAALRVYGWRRIAGRVAQVTVVLVLLLLAAALQFCWQAMHAAAIALTIVAAGIGAIDPPHPLPQGEPVE